VKNTSIVATASQAYFRHQVDGQDSRLPFEVWATTLMICLPVRPQEKVNEIMSKKKELSDLSMSTGESWIADMLNEELRQLFTRHE
jgi:hypothetical protein